MMHRASAILASRGRTVRLAALVLTSPGAA